MTSDADQDTAYRLLSTMAAIGAGVLTRRLLSRVWIDVTGEEPPNDPTDSTVGWRAALTWAAATGVAVGVGRVVGRRLAAGVWAQTRGEPAPVT